MDRVGGLMDLEGKVAVVTGGTSGIGAATAARLAEAGAVVIIGGRNTVRGGAVVADLAQRGLQGHFFALDVTSDESIREFSEAVLAEYNRVDILFNNAGVYPVAPSIADIDRDDSNNIFNVNITSVIAVTKFFLPTLIANHGVIVNNASVAGLQHFASGQSYAYSASKSAVIQFTKMLAKKYGEFVRVNCICPGVIDTPLYENLDPANFTSRIPMRRIGDPSDIAKVVKFLVSTDSDYVNGVALTVDGGLTL